MPIGDLTFLLASGALVVVTIGLILFLAAEFVELSARRRHR